MPPLRLLAAPLALALAVAVAAPAAAQQVPCENGLAVSGGTAFPCNGVDLMAWIPPAAMGGFEGNSIWGWTDPQTGREYALMGLNTGVAVVDVTAPAQPLLMGRIPTATQSSLWRDIRVYQNRAYIVSEADGHGVQVFDLTSLRGLPPSASRVLQTEEVFRGAGAATIGRIHTLFINEDTGYAYAVGARQMNTSSFVCNGGLYMIDLNALAGPDFAGCFSDDGYTHETTCVVYNGPDLQYQGREICVAANGRWPGGSDYDRLAIVDVTNKAQSVQLSEVTYPLSGYIHQGWFTEDHRYFIANDELDETTHGFGTRTLIFDFSSLTQPEYMGSFWHGTTSIDHNLYVRGNYVFAANYTTGLRILDISSLTQSGSIEGIETVAYFDTHPEHANPVFRGAWNVYPYFASGTVIVSDINRGLFVLRPTGLTVSGEPDTTATTAAMEAFPNPFAGRVSVQLTLQAAEPVRVEVLDVLGRRVALLHDGPLPAGRAEPMTLDGHDLPPGVYVVRATGASFTLARPLTRVR